jgi:DNA-binding NarL/FixJ family response regulator
VRALALADPLRETPITLRPRFVHGFLMLCTGRLDESLAALDSLRVDTLEQGRESDVPLLFLYLVWAALWRGEVHRAAALAEEALQTAFLLDDRVADGLTLSASALAHAFAGEAEHARRDSTEALQHFERLGWWGGTIWARWARGFLELSLGRPDATHEALHQLTDLLAAVGPGDPALAMFLPDEVEALVELGRAGEAEALLEPFEERSRALGRSWALGAAGRCRGILYASRGDLDGALRALEAGILQHDLSPMPFERARTLLALGQVRRRRKERRLARLALEEALSVFETVGTPLWADRARAELARVATRRAPDGLTATEERIARLAAEGLTNRAIAEQAFVSVKTVETNLKRAYRKLGISSRAQLARALDRLGPSTIS